MTMFEAFELAVCNQRSSDVEVIRAFRLIFNSLKTDPKKKIAAFNLLWEKRPKLARAHGYVPSKSVPLLESRSAAPEAVPSGEPLG